MDLGLEVLDARERAIDAGEAQVGHLVQFAQRTEDRESHLVARDLGAAGGPDRVLDPLGEQREVVVADRPALAGATDAGDDLVPAERFGDTAALDHRESGFLDGRETPAALLAGPPAP